MSLLGGLRTPWSGSLELLQAWVPGAIQARGQGSALQMQAALIALRGAGSQALQEGQNPGSTQVVGGQVHPPPRGHAQRLPVCPSEDSPSGPNSLRSVMTSKSPPNCPSVQIEV